ncbi:MAG: class I SAM-dependent methyltransferase [Saprospiraceae bacterium]|nr:class I SAM-dependent methyltransferase [Saprospiraceae bacterium]
MPKVSYSKWIKYYWNAKTIFSAHSPFLYEFMNQVMGEQKLNEDLSKVEAQRKTLIQSKKSIPFIEYGAGSSVGSNDSSRKISDVARNSLSGYWQCRLLYNMMKLYRPVHVLEIGTSLGISSAYLALGYKNATITTLEGNPASAAIAREVWQELEIDTIELKVGEFGQTLLPALSTMNRVDLAFLDGNHRKKATLDYFNIVQEKIHHKSIILVDDIYWSDEMHDAWSILKEDESVAFSIDIFRMGILFFDHSIMPKQHFQLIPYKYKPWSIGLFA